MSLREFTELAAAESFRRIDFDSAGVVGNFPGGEILIVRGEAPCLNMDVRLSPRVYITCPEYWGIEVVGSLPGGFCLPAMKPFAIAIRLAGITGSRGIEVIGARRSEPNDVPGGCRDGCPLDEADGGGRSDRFRDWQAIADFQPVVDPEPLRVRGEYRLNRRSGSVRLRERVPPGLNPTELILDLVIDGHGPGGDWVVAEGRFAAREGQYRTVKVFDRNGECVAVEVEEVH